MSASSRFLVQETHLWSPHCSLKWFFQNLIGSPGNARTEGFSERLKWSFSQARLDAVTRERFMELLDEQLHDAGTRGPGAA